MQFDEWCQDHYDEWDIASFEESPPVTPSKPPLPEVQIDSSSDEDAPPQPESTQMARENLDLRLRVRQLQEESKAAEMQNRTLKEQLSRYRNVFSNQMKRNIFGLFH